MPSTVPDRLTGPGTAAATCGATKARIFSTGASRSRADTEATPSPTTLMLARPHDDPGDADDRDAPEPELELLDVSTRDPDRVAAVHRGSR